MNLAFQYIVMLHLEKITDVDGIFSYKGKTAAVEIKFTRKVKSIALRALLMKVINRFNTIANSTKHPASIFLGLVTEGMGENERTVEFNNLQDFKDKSILPLELRLYDFDSLKQKYGIEIESTQQGHAR